MNKYKTQKLSSENYIVYKEDIKFIKYVSSKQEAFELRNKLNKKLQNGN